MKASLHNKKSKKGVDKEEDEGGAKQPKRLRITYAKGEKPVE